MPHKPSVVTLPWISSSLEVEAGVREESGIQGHSWIHGEFKARLRCMRSCLKKKKSNNRKKSSRFFSSSSFHVSGTTAPPQRVPACSSLLWALDALCLRDLATLRSERHSVWLNTLPSTFHPFILWKSIWTWASSAIPSSLCFSPPFVSHIESQVS